MNADELVLFLIDKSGGSVAGKTLLQKRGYFLSKIMDLDFNYKPHYYGPYSPLVENALGRLKGLGFLEEKTSSYGAADPIGFEVRRYDYKLTSDGREITKLLRQSNPADWKKVQRGIVRLSSAGDNGDYVDLSIAAKIHHILNEKGADLTHAEIRIAARELGWTISEASIKKAISFLRKLGMIAK